MPRKLLFLTTNKFKLATAQKALAPFDIGVEALRLEIPEIQADTNLEIARYSATTAAKQVNEPVVREDHGFYLHAFPGWPGPYMNHTERILPSKDLLRLMEGKDRTGYFEVALVYADPGGDTKEYLHKIPARITAELRPGSTDFGWDQIISIGDDERALSEYPSEDRYPLFMDNFEKLGWELS